MSYWEDRAATDKDRAYADAQQVMQAIDRLHASASRRAQEMARRIARRFRGVYGLNDEKAKELLNSPVGREEYLKLLEEIGRLGAKNPKREELLAKAAAPSYAHRISVAEAMEDELTAVCAHMAEQEVQKLEKHLQDTVIEQNLRAGFRIQQQTGLGWKFAGISEEMASRMIHEPWSGMEFSARVWKSWDKLAEALNGTLAEGIATGRSGEKIAQDIADEMGAPLHRARTLVRTETTKVCNDADFAAYEEAEAEWYRCLATLDMKTSKICRDLDGTRHRVEDAVVGKNKPPMHPNCRSTTTADFTREELAKMERRARDPITGKTVKVPGDMTYEEWLKLQKETYGEERIEAAQKMARNRAKDKKQFEEYRKILGKKQLPKDLASFQLMKYTEPEEWPKTKRAYATISEINGKENWSEAFKNKAKGTYWTMRGHDVEMSAHAIGRYLNRRDDIAGGCTTDQLALICKKPINYVQEDGREVRFYDGAAVVFNPETSEMVSFIKRNHPKNDWRTVE